MGNDAGESQAEEQEPVGVSDRIQVGDVQSSQAVAVGP
jgi:hypothetical protein